MSFDFKICKGDCLDDVCSQYPMVHELNLLFSNTISPTFKEILKGAQS